MNEPTKVIEIKAAVTAALAFLTALWGWVGWAVVVWIAAMLLDYLTGTLAAQSRGEWDSKKAREGLWHKLGEIFAVLVAALCDIAISVVIHSAGINIGIDLDAFVTPLVMLWYIITELGSIIENAGLLGAPIPEWLKKRLAHYKTKIDEAGDDGGDE